MHTPLVGLLLAALLLAPAAGAAARIDDPPDPELLALAAELDALAAEAPDSVRWRVRCVHLLVEEREEAVALLEHMAEGAASPELRAAARARADELADDPTTWPLGEDDFEPVLEALLEEDATVVAAEAEGLRLELAFHGEVHLIDGSTLPWDADRRRPYLRAAVRWLEGLRGVQGAEHHTLRFHLVSLPFVFGNGFATPLHETLEPVGDHWLPTEALIGINSFFYETGALDDPEMRAEEFDNALHEMGHAFGIGALWNLGRFDGELDAFHPLEDDRDPPDEVLVERVTHSPEHGGLVYREGAALAAFRRVHGPSWDVVPISSDGGHLYALFDEELPRVGPDGRTLPATDDELMSHRDVLSEISLGFLEDMGWQVDYAGADPLPGLGDHGEHDAHGGRQGREGQDGDGPDDAADDDPLAPWFPQRREVFGLHVVATEGTDVGALEHAALVLAQYLDNDADGEVDEPRVHGALLGQRATLVMFATEREAERTFEQLPWEELAGRALQDLYASETHPGGAARGVFDASLEEVLHLVTHAGYAVAYPDVFGEHPGSQLGELMDAARGGRFERPPRRYPEGAWYRYDDPTCDYGCQAAEYIYWGLTSWLGAQAFPGRAEEIAHEWSLATPEAFEAGDPGLHALLTDPRWRLPTRLPHGSAEPAR